MSRAGHIPMVWATDTDTDTDTATDTATGSSGIVLDRGGPPLGILPGETYPVTRRRLTEPGSLVLVTGGVVERAGLPARERARRGGPADARWLRRGSRPAGR
ncbi:SpoIIE family protein phosphatase [Streptomyces sp900116325]|uniref:SpoIIE family protein phosphatase n=1 Tax=Streptomyces sp. 900116325 TaxID=3154295 RepID=UPI0033A36241